ncbi:phosphodiester glycosidase family protein, partial [bacterium]
MKIADADRFDEVNNTLETAIGRGKLGNLETVRGMAARYDDAINFWGNPGENGWGNRSDIIVAVNGSYFGGTDTPENGMVQSGWYVKRFMDRSGGSGLVWNMNRQVFIDDCVIHKADKQILRIVDTQGNLLREEIFTGINSDRNGDSVILFTPQFGVQTPDRNDGVEIVVQLSRPLLIIPPSGNSVVGKITEIRDRTGSTLIPFDSVIVSAGENRRGALLPAAQIGATLQINQEVTSLNRACATSEAQPWAKAYASLGAALHLLESGVAYPPIEDTTRAPRTAIAFDDTYIYLIVVDGRQPDFSIGMTFQELADFILYVLGAQNAVAQDGGGSSTMVVNGSVVNRPSDICHTLFLPMVSKPGSPVISGPSLLFEENFEPPTRLQYGCERRVANAMMIARS